MDTAGGSSPVSPIPELVVEAPEELEPFAARIRAADPQRIERAAALVGLRRPGPPIRVVLAEESSEAGLRTPSWISGYAYGSLGTVVLFPGRSPSYPDSSFEELLLHELAHVFVARAAGGHPVPRWFNEGLAMYAGRPWQLEDRSRMTLALLVEDEVPLAELDTRFAEGRGQVSRAYAFSGAFVHDLMRRHGSGVGSRILSQVALGMPFAEAFRRATGTSLERAETSFWQRHSFWYRWVPVLTSSFTLWMLITLLALVAFRRRRARDAALREKWDQEEALSERELERERRRRLFDNVPPIN